MSRPRETPYCTLSTLADERWLRAALPLLQSGHVDAMEWAPDLTWNGAAPDWMLELADHFSRAGRLLGHGVTFSLLSASLTGPNGDHHDRWLEGLAEECKRRRYLHLTEHFGMMRARNFHRGAPLPVPYDPELARLGRDRLERMSAVSGCPVGLENLALAFTADDVRDHARFIGELLPGDGFYLLDLHNLYCQSVNFGIPLEELIALYPPERVRELHLSGGSWSEADVGGAYETVRRDTHDSSVPEELFRALAFALDRFPALVAVTLEQLGDALVSERERDLFREDFLRMRTIVDEARQSA